MNTSNQNLYDLNFKIGDLSIRWKQKKKKICQFENKCVQELDWKTGSPIHRIH